MGTTDQEGKIDIKVDTNYWFRRSLFGNSEEYVDKDREGWEVVIQNGKRIGDVYRLRVQLTKGKKKIIKVFLISDFLTRDILRQTGDTIMPTLDIVDREDFVNRVVRELIREPKKLSDKIKELPSLRGLPIILDSKGRLHLSIKTDKGPGFYDPWNILQGRRTNW